MVASLLLFGWARRHEQRFVFMKLPGLGNLDRGAWDLSRMLAVLVRVLFMLMICSCNGLWRDGIAMLLENIVVPHDLIKGHARSQAFLADRRAL
jgi:hypothetical protein